MLSLQNFRNEARRRAVGAALGFAASLCLYGQSSAEQYDLEQLNRQCGEAEIAGLIAECLIAKDRDLGEQLDQLYRQALISAGRNAALLRESQRNWLKYQESNCRYHEKRLSEEGPGVARLSYARCLVRSTLQRLEELKDLAVATSANARDATKNCLKVDYENSPAVTLSGHVTKQHRKVPKNSELRSTKGFLYLKLDAPLGADLIGDGTDCAKFEEVPIMKTDDIDNNQLVKWNNQHVTIVGKLNRFGSALVSPPIFIEISTIKGK
jgi:uncharacterized protein YecT (DUF1311 family)